MNRLLALFFIVMTLTARAWAIEDPKKEGLDYIAINTMYMDIRSIGQSSTAHLMGTSLTMGTYISDWIKVEGRIGTGVTDETIKDLSPTNGRDDSVDFSYNYWLSWYMGLLYPITEFSNAYAQLGFSSVHAEATRGHPDARGDIPNEFLSSSFSVSWLAGADIHITDSWYANVEFGRLHQDTKTDFKTFHVGLGLKYEF